LHAITKPLDFYDFSTVIHLQHCKYIEFYLQDCKKKMENGEIIWRSKRGAAGAKDNAQERIRIQDKTVQRQ